MEFNSHNLDRACLVESITPVLLGFVIIFAVRPEMIQANDDLSK